MRIGNVLVGPGNPCAIIAEIGNAHNGDFDRAKRLLDAAKAAGASAAKLQCYTVDELIALRGDGPAPAQWGEQGMSMRDLYTKAQTPFEWFGPLYEHAHAIGLPLFSSVFGHASLEVLESVRNPVYKIAALDSGDNALVMMALATHKLVIVSVRYYQPHLASCAQLLCPEGYPAHIDYDALPSDFAADGFRGLSSHSLDAHLPVEAVKRGAHLLEYHLQLADEPSELESNVSLTEIEFATMVHRVRDLERGGGEPAALSASIPVDDGGALAVAAA
jgi:N-acetylneuraminate synthase